MSFVLAAVLMAGCARSSDTDGVDTTVDRFSTATSDRGQESLVECTERVMGEPNTPSPALDRVAAEVCRAFLVEPMGRLVAEPGSPTATDVQQLVFGFCNEGAKQPTLESETNRAVILLKYRAIAYEDQARAWQEAGLITRYEVVDEVGNIQVEFDESLLEDVARLELSIRQMLYEERTDLCQGA